MDAYDPNNPYVQAQQAAYQAAEQQVQNWAGVAANPGMYAASAASAPVAATQPYNPSTGTYGNAARNPSYTTTVNTRPDSSLDGDAAIGNENFTKFGKHWWGAIPQGSFDALEDPDVHRQMWGDALGVGEGTRQTVENFAPMPVNYLLGMGLHNQFTNGADHPMQMQMALQDKLFDRILRGGNSSTDGTPATYLNPQQIMQTALNAVKQYNADGSAVQGQSPLADQFGDPSVPKDDQIRNFKIFISTTVANLIPKQTAQAYLNLLDREALKFKSYIAANPLVNVTFNKWIKDRLGPTGGI